MKNVTVESFHGGLIYFMIISVYISVIYFTDELREDFKHDIEKYIKKL